MSIAAYAESRCSPSPPSSTSMNACRTASPAALGGHTAAAGRRVHPVADLGLAAGLDPEQRHPAEECIGRGVRNCPGHRPAQSALLEETELSFARLRLVVWSMVTEALAVPLHLRVVAALDEPRDVCLRRGSQHHGGADDPRSPQPRAPRLHRLPATQRARPRVEQPVARVQPGAQRPVEAEAQPPGQPARGPVAAAGQPDHRLQLALGEAPLQQAVAVPAPSRRGRGPRGGTRRRSRRDSHPRCAARWCRRSDVRRCRPRPPPRSPTPGWSPSRRGCGAAGSCRASSRVYGTGTLVHCWLNGSWHCSTASSMSSSVGARRTTTPSVRVGKVLCVAGMPVIVRRAVNPVRDQPSPCRCVVRLLEQ